MSLVEFVVAHLARHRSLPMKNAAFNIVWGSIAAYALAQHIAKYIIVWTN